jgi:hypothetical protein
MCRKKVQREIHKRKEKYTSGRGTLPKEPFPVNTYRYIPRTGTVHKKHGIAAVTTYVRTVCS